MSREQYLKQIAEKIPEFSQLIINSNSENPMVRKCGPGPVGKKCKTCGHLFCRQYSNKYYKCEVRGSSYSKSTDHKVNWPACGKYKEEFYGG